MVAPTKYTLSLILFAPAAATANLFLWSETPFVCLRYFRWRENTFTFVSAPAIVQLVYLTQARGEAEAPCALAVATAKVALAICLTYVPKARDKGGDQAPKNILRATDFAIQLERESKVGCLYFKRRGGFNRVHATYRTKYAYSDVNAVSPSLLSCLTGESGE